MQRLRQLTYSIALATLALTACSGPQGPSMSASETSAAIQDLVQAGSDVATADAWAHGAATALGTVRGAGFPSSLVPGNLPRGQYSYDESSDAWVPTGASDDLVLDWQHDGSAYRLTIDWDATAPTTIVTDGTGTTSEVPTGAAATLSEDLNQVGASSFTSTWTVNQCSADEPSGATLSGWVGDANARLTLDRLGFTVIDTAALDSVGVEAEATAEAGGDSISAYLELSATGEIERDVDCLVVDFEPESVTIAFGATVVRAGERRSVDLTATASDPEYSGGALTGIGLTGSLRLGGALAVGFDGALNDRNGNGIPGDELQLTFAGGETETLERFLLDEIGWGPLFALRLMQR